MDIQPQKHKNDQRDQPAALFTGIPRARPIWGPFSGSLSAQALIVWLGTSYVHFEARFPLRTEPVLAARVLEITFNPDDKLRAPRIKIQDRGNSSRRGTGRKAAPGPGSQGALARAGAAPLLDASPGPTAPPAPTPLREFRMPEVPASQSAPQTLVQLDLPATLDLRPQIQVPTIVMLASETPRKLAPKPFVAPPEQNKTAPVPNEVALDLRPPVFEAEPGYVKPASILQHDPKLPAPVGRVSPVAGVQAPVPTKQAATVTAELPAPPVNVISLPAKPGMSVVLPPLNQVSARDSVSGEGSEQQSPGATSAANDNASRGSDPMAAPRSGGGREDARPGAAKSKGDAGGTGASERGSSSETGALARSHGPGDAGEGAAGSKTGAGGNGSRDLSGSGSGGIGGGSGASTEDAGSGVGTNAGSAAGTGPGAVTGRGSGSGAPGNSLSASTPIRILRPINGNYDVAIVQSGASIPGSAGFLKGRPVYSVYLSFSDGKDWILQYCLPPDQNRRATQSQVVQLGNVEPLTAPYAYLMLKPRVQLRGGVRYGFIHAFVNQSGGFDEAQEVGDPVIENVSAVINALEKWKFRPASKDGVPALVEILLCIPTA